MSYLRRLAPYAATALLSVGGFLAYNLGPVHAAGLRHVPGGCEPCDRATAQVTLNLVQQAQAAGVSSASTR